ncbi:MAG: type II secretion system protein GspG [Rickettsiales bacterium]|nr:type II secretion system protein GspG [Rickettsiales bacterium]
MTTQRIHLNRRLSRLAGRSRSQAGMTLIEIMVVLTLLGLLMTVLAVNFFGMAEEQKVKITLTQMKTIQGRLDAFKQEYGKYPTSSQGLNSLVSPPPKKNGRTPGAFLDDSNLLVDPWGNQLEYSVPGPNGKPYKITSRGADSSPGGDGPDADIDNWQGM